MQPKIECKMSCHLDRVPIVSASDIIVLPRPKFFEDHELRRQYHEMRPQRFPTDWDARVLAKKDRVMEFLGDECWIAFQQARDGTLITSAEVMADFDPDDCRLENVMTRSEYSRRGIAGRVCPVALRHMLQFGYKWATWSCQYPHAPFYERCIAGKVVETWEVTESQFAASA